MNAFKSARDAGQDKCLKDVGVPTARELMLRYYRATGLRPQWQEPRFDDTGFCTSRGTVRIQQAAPRGAIYRSFSLRLSRTSGSGHTAVNTEFQNMKNLLQAHPHELIMFTQIYVQRGWKELIDAASISLFDLLSLCSKDQIRSTAPDKNGYVSEFFYVDWKKAKDRGCFVEQWSQPSGPMEKDPPSDGGAGMIIQSLFE